MQVFFNTLYQRLLPYYFKFYKTGKISHFSKNYYNTYWVSGANVIPTSFVCICAILLLLMVEIKMYGLAVSSNDTMFTPGFVGTSQLFHKLQ
jgi:hypothetical protein